MTRSLTCFLLLIVLCVQSASGEAKGSTAVDIADRRELFIDRYLVEALEGEDRAIEDRLVVPENTNQAVPENASIANIAAKDSARLRRGKHLPDFAMAKDFLDNFWRQQAFHRRSHVVKHLVDDAVVPDVRAHAGLQFLGFGVGLDVEADDDRV